MSFTIYDELWIIIFFIYRQGQTSFTPAFNTGLRSLTAELTTISEVSAARSQDNTGPPTVSQPANKT